MKERNWSMVMGCVGESIGGLNGLGSGGRSGSTRPGFSVVDAGRFLHL